MDHNKCEECRPTLGVLSSVANKVGQNESKLLRVDGDPKERKREGERARFASMSKERKNELNKKRRELYQRKKVDKNTISCKEVIDPTPLRNERDKARRASMPSIKREEINRKRREAYQRKKEQHMLSKPNNGGEPSRNKENEDPANNGQIPSANIAHMRRENKCTYSRQWYKNMPSEKRKIRQERERLYNATVKRKEIREHPTIDGWNFVPTLYIQIPLL